MTTTSNAGALQNLMKGLQSIHGGSIGGGRGGLNLHPYNLGKVLEKYL